MNSIVLICFNRPEKLTKTLSALAKVRNVNSYNLVIVQQIGNSESCLNVTALIKAIDWIKITHLTTQYQSSDSIQKKVNTNIYKGFSYAFETLHSNRVVLIEEDILLGYDALDFVENLMDKYSGDSLFRAVELFSIEPKSSHNLYAYSKCRFGITNGWAINKNIWFNFVKKIWINSDERFFDSIVETYFKTGFLVVPHASRTLDIGWGENALTCPLKKSEVQSKNEKSWVGSEPLELKDYKINQTMQQFVRSDFVLYKWYSPLTYAIFRLIRKLMLVLFKKEIDSTLPKYLIGSFINCIQKK